MVTDARFSGVSTGACIGHVGPEALAGGPIGKLCDGDIVQIVIDRNQLAGSVDFVGEPGPDGLLLKKLSPDEGAAVLAKRPPRADVQPDPALPPETRLWAALQRLGGGTWGGCVYDVDQILKALNSSQGKS